MHPTSSDRNIPLETRWRNSQRLANYFNEQGGKIESDFFSLRKRLTDYNLRLKKKEIEDQDVIEFQRKKKLSRLNNLFIMTALFPFATLGFFHTWPVYILVKRFVEKSFKRAVFYGSVKLLLGLLCMGLINIPVVFIFHKFIYASWTLAIFYYLLIGVFFLAMIVFNGQLIIYKRKGEMSESDVRNLSEEREKLALEISNSELGQIATHH
jgi:uncharacterized protein YacL